VLDTDKDGIPDYLDLDSDGDGISDVVEADGTDADQDGRADGPSDSRGIPESAQGGLTPPDTDGDGKRDFQDVDSDNDGIPDNTEGQGTYVKPAGKDTDGDGLDDAYDKNNGGKPIVPVDTDGDGKPDYRDVDSDGDGIPDSVERGPDGTKPLDTDGDGTPDYRDLDSDNDGIPDSVERGPDGTKPRDTDGDGLPDYRDLDSDNDGIPDTDEKGADPLNPVDTDGDGLPDYRDVDSNNDGIPDGETLLIWKKASPGKISGTLGEIEITFTFILTNARPEPITDVQIKEDLTRTFPSPMTFRVSNVESKGVLVPNPAFDGRGNLNMLASGITLAGFKQDSIKFTVVFDPMGSTKQIENIAEGSAVTKWGPVVRQSIDIINSNGRKHGAGDPTESLVPLVDVVTPDVITPNGDGFNDVLIIQRPSGVKVSLTVFNRWGQLMYKNVNYLNDWGGVSLNGTPLVQGTYYYIAEFTGPTITGKEVKKKYLTIKRNY
jgi:gliding motility-associated-like protein